MRKYRCLFVAFVTLAIAEACVATVFFHTVAGFIVCAIGQFLTTGAFVLLIEGFFIQQSTASDSDAIPMAMGMAQMILTVVCWIILAIAWVIAPLCS